MNILEMEDEEIERIKSSVRYDEVTHRPLVEWRREMREAPIGIEKLRVMRRFLMDFREESEDHFNLESWFDTPSEEAAVVTSLQEAAELGVEMAPTVCGTAACVVGWAAYLNPEVISLEFRQMPWFDFDGCAVACDDDLDLSSEGLIRKYFGMPATLYRGKRNEIFFIADLPNYVIYQGYYQHQYCDCDRSEMTSRQHVVSHIDQVLEFMEEADGLA